MDPQGSIFEDLSPALRLSVDRLCTRFEQAWKRGDVPHLEDYCSQSGELERTVLLRELLYLDLEYRQRRSETPCLADYTLRFPEHATLVTEMWSVVQRSSPLPALMPEIPGYEILQEQGRGGMGVVYKAWQVRLKRLVALKMIRAGTLPDAKAIQRFRREAETIARLQHPNFVQIFEVGECPGNEAGTSIPYFAFEYVEGGSLDKHMAGSPLPPDEAAALTETLSRAIHVAHQAGIVHRDLKPSNVLLSLECDGSTSLSFAKKAASSRRTPKITDFGLAKRLEDSSAATASGVVVGTPSYMAPEQARARGAEIGPAADIYALGAILYELLTGRPPFKAATSLDTVLLVLSEEPAPPSRLQPRLPRDLETICLKCLAKQPAGRYATALELAEDLRRYRAGEPIHARPIGAAGRLWRWCRRKPVAAGLFLMSIVAVLSLPAAILGALYNVQLADSLNKTRQAQQAEALARQAEQEAARKAEEFHYFHRMGLAQSEWREARVARVEQLLEECPPSLRHWEWHYLKRLCRPQGLNLLHEASVYTLHASDDGKLVAAGEEDGTVTIWERATGKRLQTLRGHTASVHDVRFDRGGWRVITAASDNTAKIWDTASGKELLTFSKHTNGLRAALFDPNGRWAASAGKDYRLMIWDLHTGSVLHDLQGEALGYCLAVSPDGRQLAYGTHNLAMLWDAQTGQLLRRIDVPGAAVRGLAFNAHGNRLAVATDDNLIRIWDLASGVFHQTLKGHTGAVYSVAFSADGQRLVTGSLDATVKLWDADTGKELAQFLGHTGRINGVAFGADDAFLASGGMDKSLKIWDLKVKHETVTIPAHQSVRTVAWSPDGDRLASAGVPGDIVKVWEANTGKLLLSLKTEDAVVYHVAFSRDGKWLAAASHSGTVRIWDTATGQPVHALRGHAGTALVAVFSPDGQRLATGGNDKTARLWDVATGHEVLCYGEHQDQVHTLAFSPDGQSLTSAGEDQTVKVWEVGTGRTTWSESEPTRAIRAVGWSPGGQRVAAANFAGAVKLRDAATGQLLGQLQGHTYTVNGLAWSPDGKRLATCSADRTILIWQAVTGQQALTLRGHTDAVQAVAWSPDGHRLASGGEDGTIRIWDGRPFSR